MASKSRPQRWADACANARKALGEVEAAKSMFEEALSELNEIRQEYEEWQSGLPENLESSALAEKLGTVVDLDCEGVEIDLSEAESLLDEAEGMDLPRGFGRD